MYSYPLTRRRSSAPSVSMNLFSKLRRPPVVAAPTVATGLRHGGAHELASAVAVVKEAYESGTDTEYDEALKQLSELSVQLTPTGQERINSLLSSTHEVLSSVDQLNRARAALAGDWETVKKLPGHVELVRLGPLEDNILASVPDYAPLDSADVRRRVEGARSALTRGSCSRCLATLKRGLQDTLELKHASDCRFSEDQITWARTQRPR